MAWKHLEAVDGSSSNNQKLQLRFYGQGGTEEIPSRKLTEDLVCHDAIEQAGIAIVDLVCP